MQLDPSGNNFRFHSSQNEREHFWYVPQCPRPSALVSTQWLSFRFRSHGMLSCSPASHFAVVLRARLRFDVDAKPVSISGRGITLGDTSLATPSSSLPDAIRSRFGGSRGTQIESFWPGGNFLFRETALFAEGLQDRREYRVHVHVNDARWIGYGVCQDPDPTPGPIRGVRDLVDHPVDEDAVGVLIALGRGAQESGDWSAEFLQIATGWF